MLFQLVSDAENDTIALMKCALFFRGFLAALLLFLGVTLSGGQEVEGAVEVEEPNEKATRYHSLLLKKPGNAMVFSRFVDAWLDTGSKKGLTDWLSGEAKEGEAADWRVLGALHQYMGEDEEALKALNEAVERDGENAGLRLSRAKMQARLLAFEAALVDLEVAAKDEKVAIEASKLKGMYLARSGQVEAAVKAWKEVIAAYPKDEDLREDLIEVEVMEGLYDDAIEASTGLVKMTKDPYKKTLRRLRLGDIQILAGDREAGLKTYEEIMAATGEGSWLEREVLAQVERVFLKEDDVKGLRDFYQKLREEHPRRVSIRKVLARQMALNDEMKEAIALFREVLKITPGDLGNREEFVAFLEANEKWKEAKEELMALVELRKDDALLWERLARIEAKLNDAGALKVALAKVAELKKGAPEGLLATAALYEQAKLAAEAEALLREGRGAFPDSLEVAEGLASFLVQNKKEDEALEIWKTMAKGADREGLLRVARSLSSHGKGEVAFEILSERIAEFQNDALILTQYCKLASSVEEAGQAIPQGLALVNQATAPTELEGAIKTALRLMARAEKVDEIQATLAGDAELGVAGKCLLAALYADQGDSMKASEILTKTAALPEGSLARFYRVRFEEERGNLEEAIVIMREIIETPEGRKTVHLRRLVDLLERSGDYDKALVAVGDWKRIAPGDHSAWQRRAKLLQANAQPEEAVVELRRMIGKFGADEERRAELAAALIEAAEYTPAQRIYEQLYSESEKLETKLKWAGEMAKLAETEGKLEELLEDFDRRKRSNPRSVAPLLAIAEIHRVLDHYEERRSALLEASRRRPEDTQLLARIAEVEERAGEFDRAVGILRDAVKRDKTPESKRRLASLLLKNGEVQGGLDLLSEIPGAVNKARGLEGIVQALVSAQEYEHAQSFLEKHLGKHEGDWRLRYLQAMVFKLEGEHEKSLALFTSLLKGGDEIPGVKPLVSGQNVNPRMGPWKALFGANGWEELTAYQPYVTQRGFNPSGQSRGPRIPLPGTPRELQLLSLLQGSTLLAKIPEKRMAEAQKALSLPGMQDVDVLVSMMSGNDDGAVLLQKRAEENPDNVGLFALSLVYKANSGGITLKEFEKAEEVLLEDHPETFGMIVFSAMQSPEISGERMVKALEESLRILPKDEVNEMMQLLSFYTFSPYFSQGNGGKDMTPIKSLMAAQAVAAVEISKGWEWMSVVVPHLFSEGKIDEAVDLINRLCEWQAESKNAGPTGIMAMMGMGRSMGVSQLLNSPAFPPSELKGVPSDFLSLFPVQAQKKPQGNDGNAQAQLLAQLQLADEANGEKKEAPEIGDQAAGIKNPALRALAFLSMEKEAEAEKLIEEMLVSREESSLLFAAGYLHDRDDPRAYEALLQARMLPLSRDSRKKVDGYLAVVGSSLAKGDETEIDLEPAKRAALRLRRVLGIDEREKLGEVLVKLGLQKEAKRLAAAPKPVQSSGRRGMNSLRNQPDRITELKKAGNIDGAAREASKQFRSLNNGQNNDYELRQLKEKLSSKELREATLAKLDPGESESTKRLLEFAQAQQLFGTKEKAREVYEKILSKNPKHTEANIGAIECTPFAEIDQERVVIRKDGKVHAEATSEVFASLWEGASSNEELERYLSLCQLTASFLNELPPSGEPGRNLSWVPYHILDFATDTYIQNVSLAPLVEAGNGGSSSRDKEATKKRDEAVKEVFLGMIKHPQIAEQGFMLLEAGKVGLSLDDDDLLKLARVAMEQMIEKPSESNFYGGNELWSKVSGNGSTSSGELENAQGPMSWLMTHAAETGTEVLTPELLERFKKAQPEKFALLDQARALAKAEPAEAEEIYAGWKSELPELKRMKAIAFAKQVLLFTPKAGPWADDLEQLMLDPKGGGFNSNDREWARLVADWGGWRFRTVGAVRYEAFLLALFEGSFGPSDKWEVLAQLGEDAMPQKYRQAGYAFQRISEALFADADLVKATLLFVGKHPLEKFVYDLDDAVQGAWAPNYGNAESSLKRLVENRLLTVEEGEAKPSPTHFLLVAESMRKVRFSGSRESEKLVDFLLKEEGLDPLLRNAAAASLRNSTQGRKLIQPILEGDIEFVTALVEAEPERSFAVLRRWFPRMESSDISAPLAEVFESFAVEAREKNIAMMEGWIKDGVPGISGRDDDKFWAEFVTLVPMNEALAHQLLDRVMKDVRLSKDSSRHSSNGVYLKKRDRWMSSLLGNLQSGKSQLDLPQQVRLLDSFYRGEEGRFVLEPVAASRYQVQWAWNLFLSADKAPRGKGEEAPILEWVNELNAEQQATLAVLLSDGFLNASTGDFKRLKKHQKALGESAPALAELVKIVTNYRSWKEQNKNEGLKKGSSLYGAFLNRKDLPNVLKIDLLARVSQRAPALHSGGGVCTTVTQIMADYGKSERNFAVSSLNDTVTRLGALNFPGFGKVAGGIASEADRLLLSAEAGAMRREKGLPEVAQSIIKLALKGGEIKLAAGILRKDYAAYRGNLEVMVALGRAGEWGLAKKLVAANAGRYEAGGLGLYDKDLHEVMAQMLKEVPEENRYHLELALSSLQDGKKDRSPETPRSARLAKLADDFAARGAGLKEEARIQVLAIFAGDDATSLTLATEFRKVYDKLTIADSFTFEENSSSLLRSDGFEILKQVIHHELAAKNFAGVRAKMEEFQEVLATDGNEVWQLRYQVGKVFGLIGQELIALAVRSPEDALAAIPEVKAYFDLAMKGSGRSDPINSMDGVGLIVHELVEQGDAWKSYLENHPRKTVYQGELKKRSRQALFDNLANERWRQPEMAENRKKVLRALLGSALYAERDLAYIHDYYGLIDSKLFTPREVVDEVAALPKDHPFKAEASFHAASLKLYRLKVPKKEAVEAYTEVLALARELGKEKLVNQITAHRCDVLFRNKRKAEAKTEAATVKIDQLPERDRKWVKEAMPKWLK